jgi:3-deoxy-D-manno-octulosonic-acid transferase
MNAGVARAVYSTLLALLKPAYVLRLWLRGRAEPLYRHAVGERFGFYERSDAAWTGGVWVHAVSLGETRAASALIDALRTRQPGLRLLLTHGTATGREAGLALLRDGDRQSWLPVDTPGAVRRFFEHFRPSVGVLMETEIWPNLLQGARAAGVPMVLANARLSERSLRKGQRFAALMAPAVESLSLVLAQTEDDATRLRESGARDVQVCGNLKFDMNPDPALVTRGRGWREALGRAVVMAAATREGEEALLLASWQRHADAAPVSRPLLLVVPRHPQRFDEVEGLLRQAGLRVVRRRSWGDSPNAEALSADAWLGDSMGEMPLYYGVADVALLGGSFAPLGGQNLIEAAACGCPLVMGPHTFNFAQAADLSLEAGASLRVADMDEAVLQAFTMLAPERREATAKRALAFADAHRGAAGRMAERISAWLA